MTGKDRHYLLFDEDACAGLPPGLLMQCRCYRRCDSDREARRFAGEYGAMACYSMPDTETDDGTTALDASKSRHEWNWDPEEGFEQISASDT